MPWSCSNCHKIRWFDGCWNQGRIENRVWTFWEMCLKLSKQLQTFNKAGTIKIGKDGIIGDNWAPCILVGYLGHHNGNHYHIYNPKTKQIMETRDMNSSKHIPKARDIWGVIQSRSMYHHLKTPTHKFIFK